MNSITEKEKKLSLALTELKNLNLKNPDLQSSIENLNQKKNQLEIEKKGLEDKYQLLKEDFDSLSKKLDEIKSREKVEERKQIEFSENSICFFCSIFLLLCVSSNFLDKLS